MSPPAAGHVTLPACPRCAQSAPADSSVSKESQPGTSHLGSDGPVDKGLQLVGLGARRGRLIRLHLDGDCMPRVMANITWLLVMVHRATATSFSKAGFWM